MQPVEVTATTAAVEEIKAAPNALQAEAVAKRFAWPEELRQAAVEALGVHGIGEAEATEILGLPPVAEPPPAKTIEPEGWLALQCSAFATFHDVKGKKNTVAAALRSHQKPPKARRDLLHRIGELKAAEVALGEGTEERKAAKDKVRDAKLGLPSFIYQGTFDGEGKGDEHWREATGIVALDYDGFTSAEDAKAFKRLLFDKCGFVGAAWLSGSGMGVHALALGPVTETAEEYTAVWRGVDAAVNQRVGRSADPSRKNRNGILFGSHDPDLLWRTAPEEFAPTKAEPQTKRPAKPSANGGGETTAALRGLDDMLAHIDCPSLEYKDWLAVLMGAHSEFGDQALKAIHVWCQTDPDRYEEKDVNSRWRGFKRGGGTGIGTVMRMASQGGWKPTTASLVDASLPYAWGIYNAEGGDKDAALARMRAIACGDGEPIDAILMAERDAIEAAHAGTRERLAQLSDELGRRKHLEADVATALDEEYDELLAKRQTAEDAARKTAIGELAKLRDAVKDEQAAAAAAMSGGEDGIPAGRAAAASATIGAREIEAIDEAILQARFMVPLPGDAVAEAIKAGALGDLWSEDENATHTGSFWGKYTDETSDVEWLVPHMIPRGMVTVLFGEPGLGKSRITCQLAASESLRTSTWTAAFLPTKNEDSKVKAVNVRRRSRPTMTVIANAEDTEATFAWRMAQIAKALNIPLERGVDFTKGLGALAPAMARIDFFNPRGAIWGPIGDGKGGGSTHIDTEAGLTKTGRALLDRCEKIGATLLILDPLANLYASSENSRAHVGAFMRTMNAWANRTNTTVVMIGHPPKGGSDFSGSTSWVGAARSALTLKRRKVRREKELKSGKQTWKVATDKQPEDTDKKAFEDKMVPCLRVAKHNHSRWGRTCWLDNSKMGVFRCTMEEAYRAVGDEEDDEREPPEDDGGDVRKKRNRWK